MIMIVNPKDTEDIRNSLIALCGCDEDMNGNNGDEYLWEEAKGYYSNAEYLADYVMENCKDVKNMFKTFVERWVRHDSYYDDYNLEFAKTGKNIIVALTMLSEGGLSY